MVVYDSAEDGEEYFGSMDEAEENAEEAKEDMEVYYPDPYDIPEIPIIKRDCGVRGLISCFGHSCSRENVFPGFFSALKQTFPYISEGPGQDCLMRGL